MLRFTTLSIAIGSLLCGSAAAQPSPDTKASADALFADGQRLLAAGDVNHACQKLAASLAVLDQLGVRLGLADCHERQGRLASAWVELREAAALADKQADPRAAAAHQRADALTPRLARIKITVGDADRLPGLVVHRDGTPLPDAAIGLALPSDPGVYSIDAIAPGHQPWSTKVTVSKPGELIAVTVPRLAETGAAPVAVEPAAPAAPASDVAPPAAPAPAATPAPAPAATPTPEPPADPRARRQLLAIGVGAGGVIALVTGIGIGLDAKHKWDVVGADCTDNLCDAHGLSLNHSARNVGTAGTIVGGVGVAALVTGVVLYLTAPAAQPLVEHARLDVDPAGVRVGYQARF
jgi:serine/threonine-protein kinase